MLRFIAQRLALSVPTLLLISVVVFALIRFIPGDPALLMLGDMADPQSLASTRAALGLDHSIGVQFAYWLQSVLSGDLGVSITSKQPVLELILDRFSVSASIVLVAVLLAALIAVPAGLFAAWKQDSALDLGLVTGATLLLSIPSFWLGLLLLYAFGIKLNWLPVVGYAPFAQNPAEAVTYLVLPIVTLTLVELGAITRMARASTIEVLRLEYIAHARAKGLSERAVLWRHALPNAFAPTWTLIGLILGNLLGGIAVLETVFTLPGIGRLMVDAIYARDYPVLQGCLLLITFIYVAVNLLVDLLYPLFDPRVKL
ncbi:ABC transporter permease [Pseudomonas sp. FW306-02-F02-AA]|uniref:Peptide ABC transporter n=1 Tax=Pseudomonas fluorescens TaxID=294 RepID=A0A0N9X182_PSEFL|nr:MULTISPECIES: ABC transporter permease [Pseudomonas]ALI04323.1 peptide ABC transporter [Pseudomonas fluorescens]PMZ01661.1 ABC transporter permease [Pseudomonas sp. FW306-02-F02-AB]PMZ10128.1 ABC transporter permease [Pseudomonas sp. FW306-02-H06C]PMZ13187.1 ABC transporter permease [Pseudomonas sp. FW306-02-F02-AA]PMZ19231.1 nickel ABC transporter permease subunit NikB [Pseudomonas sp. FW306-02-F08-AA]